MRYWSESLWSENLRFSSDSHSGNPIQLTSKVASIFKKQDKFGQSRFAAQQLTLKGASHPEEFGRRPLYKIYTKKYKGKSRNNI